MLLNVYQRSWEIEEERQDAGRNYINCFKKVDLHAQRRGQVTCALHRYVNISVPVGFSKGMKRPPDDLGLSCSYIAGARQSSWVGWQKAIVTCRLSFPFALLNDIRTLSFFSFSTDIVTWMPAFVSSFDWSIWSRFYFRPSNIKMKTISYC